MFNKIVLYIQVTLKNIWVKLQSFTVIEAILLFTILVIIL